MRKLPIALTIAGSDSGGGAGIQADLKTFAALGVHGTSAIACLTAQNPREVREAIGVERHFLVNQLEAIFAEVPPAAVKTGMLFTSSLIEAVIDFFAKRPRVPLIVDPVMVATSGALLLERRAVESMKKLLERATLITPNLDEAQVLLARKIKSVDELRSAARELFETFGCAALAKGGHLKTREATDVYYDGRKEMILRAPLVRGVRTHGTGCTFSAAIAAHLALGKTLPAAVKSSKAFITRAIRNTRRIGRHQALGWV